jgi:Protein of unknown function (DUF1593)
MRPNGRSGTAALAAVLCTALLCTSGTAAAQAPDAVDDAPGKPRVIVLSDIGNEPDDQMSFTRFLVYSNRLNVEGLVATTSTWQRDVVRPDIMHTVIDHYGQVRSNLLRHARGFPTVTVYAASSRRDSPPTGWRRSARTR